MKISELRSKHPQLIYKSATHKLSKNGLELEWEFLLEPDITFRPSLLIPGITKTQLATLSKSELQWWIFQLGMAELPSYWKAACSPEIMIEAGNLSKSQQAWWKDLFIKGLGEFFFVNQIDSFNDQNFLKFIATEPKSKRSSATKSATPPQPSSFLIPVGGGKDSVVSIEVLKNWQKTQPDISLTTFVLNPSSQAAHSISTLSQLTTITADRTIDPKLLELNKKGYLNGHTPFSAYLAFVSSFVARLFGIQAIALSNEKSANEGNLTFHGLEINHQYSKSYEFETAFQSYLSQAAHENGFKDSPYYFSLLRPLSELQIGQLFAQATQEHPQVATTFRSCNRGQKTNTWCLECPKCLFAFAVLYPFLGEEKISKVFSRNLYQDKSLFPIAKDLLGHGSNKPLECVGLYEESEVAFWLAIKNSGYLQDKSVKLPPLLKNIWDSFLSKNHDLGLRAPRLLQSWNSEHSLPPNLDTFLQRQFHTPVKVILGLGTEGQSTLNYLTQTEPLNSLVLADKKPLSELSPNIQQHLEKFNHHHFVHLDQEPTQLSKIWEDLNPEVIFKSAGIPPEILEKDYGLAKTNKIAEITSNTALFFETFEQLAEVYPGRVMSIGVTGTKGKSTTAAAIHHLLSQNGVKSLLGGNIGVAPLDLLQDLEQLLSGRDVLTPLVVVLELSSHQLQNLKKSPQVAVVLDVKAEHLDYYGDFKKYLDAKKSITKWQTARDLVISRSDSQTAQEIASQSLGEQLTFGLTPQGGEKLFLSKKTISWHDLNSQVQPLIKLSDLKTRGQHNALNLMPAIIIGRLFRLEPQEITRSLKTFSGLPHRLEFVSQKDGISYYNDSLATTPQAAIAALESFEEKVVLIAGGFDRGLDYSPLSDYLNEHLSDLKGLVLFEPSGKNILKGLSEEAQNLLQPKFAETMKEAVTQAQKMAETGDVILLSPASASFGKFKDYADRGRRFGSLVT